MGMFYWSTLNPQWQLIPSHKRPLEGYPGECLIDTTASFLYLVIVIFQVPQRDHSSCHMKMRTGRMDVCYPRIQNTKGHEIHLFNGRSDGTLYILQLTLENAMDRIAKLKDRRCELRIIF